MRRLTGQEFIIGSPDLDVYTEILPSDGPDVVYLQPEGGGRPSGVPRDDELYTFATPPSGREKAEMEEAGEFLFGEISKVLLHRGALFGPPGPPEPGGEEQPRKPAHRVPNKRSEADMAAGLVWVSVAGGRGYLRGDDVSGEDGELPEGTVVMDNCGLARDYDKAPMLIERIRKKALDAYRLQKPGFPGQELSAEPIPEGGIPTPRGDKPLEGAVDPTDARVLPLRFSKIGKRLRLWGDVAESIQEVSSEEWPVSGPRTTSWVVQFFVRRATGPEDHHRWWMTTCRLNNSDWGVAEHGQCCRYLEVAGGFDQLDLPNIAIVELVARRLQTIEFQYRERTRRSDSSMVFGMGVSASVAGSVAISPEEADLFDGADRVHTTLCCAPALVKFVTEQLSDESKIAKEARKAREEQQLVRQHHLQPAPPGPSTSANEINAPAGPPGAAADPRKKKKGGGRGQGGGNT